MEACLATLHREKGRKMIQFGKKVKTRFQNSITKSSINGKYLYFFLKNILLYLSHIAVCFFTWPAGANKHKHRERERESLSWQL